MSSEELSAVGIGFLKLPKRYAVFLFLARTQDSRTPPPRKISAYRKVFRNFNAENDFGISDNSWGKLGVWIERFQNMNEDQWGIHMLVRNSLSLIVAICFCVASVNCQQKSEEPPAGVIEKATAAASNATSDAGAPSEETADKPRAAAKSANDANTAKFQENANELKTSIDIPQSTINSLKVYVRRNKFQLSI